MYEKVFDLTLGTLDPSDYDRSGPTAFETMVANFKDGLMPEGWLDESDLGGAGWTKSGGGVPEPTSGLLLVLGGAMLALRRRR